MHFVHSSSLISTSLSKYIIDIVLSGSQIQDIGSTDLEKGSSFSSHVFKKDFYHEVLL